MSCGDVKRQPENRELIVEAGASFENKQPFVKKF